MAYTVVLMAQLNNLDWTAMVLVIVGALNWGLYGLGAYTGGRIDLVDMVLGSVPWLQNLVYILVGLSGLYLIYYLYR